jgi:hypothetical protein
MGLLDVLGLKSRTPALTASGTDPVIAPPLPGTPVTGAQPTGPVVAPVTGALPTGAVVAPVSGTAALTATEAVPPLPEMVAFTVARAAVQLLVVALNTHPQTSKITANIGQATTKLGLADIEAGKPNFVDANKLVEEARVICVDAKKLADDWADYTKKLASARALMKSFEGFPFAVATIAAGGVNIVNAQGFVAKSPPDFVNALAQLAAIDSALAPITKGALDDVKVRLATLEAMDAKVKDFAKDELVKIRAVLAKAEAAYASNEWSLCLTYVIGTLNTVAPAQHFCERRDRYETQRTTTAAALATVKAKPELKERAAEIEASVGQADMLASHGSMKIEEGIKVLQAAAESCKIWLSVAPTIVSYNTARVEADKELKALDAHAAKDRISVARESARKILAAAASFASLAATGNNAAQGWSSALTEVTRARADMAEAKKLADSLGPALAAGVAAANPGDIDGMKSALATLKADGATAGKAPFAAEAADEFKNFNAAVVKAEAALAKNDGKGGAKALAEAGKSLANAKAIQVEHGQYASTLTTVEGQLVKLQALPGKAAIKARIEVVVKALADAKSKDKSHAGAEAMLALRRAADAANAAEQADKDRIAYDKAAVTTTGLVNAVIDPKVKATLIKQIASATSLADGFRFAEADKALKQIELRVDEAKLNDAIKNDPTKIVAIAARMAATGGDKAVDDLIQKQTSPAIIAALAKGRYGKEFNVDGGANAAQEAKTMKAMCSVFSKVAKNIVGNTSITGVKHTDAANDAGGDYDSSTTVISMKGRPGDKRFDQQFGSKQKAQDKTGKTVDQLPKVDKDCEPADEKPVDYLSFAAYHEVAHGIDDQLTFMARLGDKPQYGGWIAYGSDVQPIADRIGPNFKFYTTPEQKKYVLDKILSRPTTAPPVPALPGDWAKAKQDFDDWYTLATTKDVYRHQSECATLTIGDRIYQEAYPRRWVSYLAAARSKGLTGYQFRAPGEWFAELYAGYKTGKLGSKHPALDWLKKL